MKHIEYLIRQCFRGIPNLPEVANLIRVPEEHWMVFVELHDNKDESHAATAYWQFHPETERDGFITVVIVIGMATWHFRGRHEGDVTRMRYVGTQKAHPFSITYMPWYDGVPSSGATTPTCSRCGAQTTTVKQAYFGGGEMKSVARCENCQQEPCFSLGGDPPSLRKAFYPSLV